jgi:sialate O-acetylesterase
VEFNNVAGGLKSRDGKDLTWFEIIDAEEGPFVAAQARIEGAAVVLSAPEVKKPVAMRFAWSMLAEPNLQNSEGLPAGAFRAGTAPKRDLLALKVPEAKNYEMVYDLDLSKLGATITYAADLRSKINRAFDRVAYFVELTDDARNTQYVYVSMDAFTQDLGKLGIPTLASGAKFQQAIANMNVFSNVKGVATGTGLAGGNIEFWPHNYGTGNSANVPKASAQEYDFGDEPSDPADGYGCMQIHNHDAKQTLFAINHWREGAKADIGLGNQAKGSPDWTFSANAGSYQTKRLRVMVRVR